VVNPRWFFEPSADTEKDATRIRTLRAIDFALLVVAGLYLLVKFMART
jgi:hypothetical protein